MKTDTRVRILAYIRERRVVKPKEIVVFFQYSPQIIFKHLKNLLTDGLIGKNGKPPHVEYFAIPVGNGKSNPSAIYHKNMSAFDWALDEKSSEPPADFFCQSSDVWQARFSRVESTLARQKFDANLVAFLASAIGEVGDNCFTHNAPGWVDVRGCWYEFDLQGRNVKVVIADRGRGILASLKAVRPSLSRHKDALLVALTEFGVTGRAPELRGNGLKHVMSVLTKLPSGSFKYQTGNAIFTCALPLDKSQIGQQTVEVPSCIRGTYCEFNITLPYAS